MDDELIDWTRSHDHVWLYDHLRNVWACRYCTEEVSDEEITRHDGSST